MSTRLKALYEQMILEHNRNPRHFNEIDPCTHHAHGVNPLCGDDFNVYVNVKDGQIDDIGFKGQGCAISKSSGSLMASALKGLSKEEALDLKNKFIEMLVTDKDAKSLDIGKLAVFEGVKGFPVRVKCATLVWRALESALENDGESISTE